MGITTLQKLPVLELRLTRPVMGTWVARLEVDYQDTSQAFTGLLQLDDEKVTYFGTAREWDQVSGVASLLVVGGRGGLAKDTVPQHFRDVDVRTLLDALLASVGERLDATSTRSVLDARLPFWSFAAERTSEALRTLAAKVDATWRVLPNGNVWFGTDRFTAVEDELAKSSLNVDRDGSAGSFLLASDTLELGPGVSLAGRRVGRVEHHFSREEPLRTTFWIAP